MLHRGVGGGRINNDENKNETNGYHELGRQRREEASVVLLGALENRKNFCTDGCSNEAIATPYAEEAN